MKKNFYKNQIEDLYNEIDTFKRYSLNVSQSRLYNKTILLLSKIIESLDEVDEKNYKKLENMLEEINSNIKSLQYQKLQVS